MKRLTSLFLVSLLSGATTLGAYKLFIEHDGRNSIVTTAPTNYNKTVGFAGEAVDFTSAAANTVHAVVHVKNVSVRKNNFSRKFIKSQEHKRAFKW